MTELVGHKNGVTSMAFANNELFTGSLDHYVRIWDVQSIYDKIDELATMAAEDIRSRKLRRVADVKKGKKAPGKSASKGALKGGKGKGKK